MIWPFTLLRREIGARIRRIDARHAVCDQIRPEEVATIAALGFRTILCARPDGESGSQPAFAEIAREAKRHGMKTVHVPVAGMVTRAQAAQARKALSKGRAPVLGYCRSGARVAALFSALDG